MQNPLVGPSVFSRACDSLNRQFQYSLQNNSITRKAPAVRNYVKESTPTYYISVFGR